MLFGVVALSPDGKKLLHMKHTISAGTQYTSKLFVINTEDNSISTVPGTHTFTDWPPQWSPHSERAVLNGRPNDIS